MQALHKNICWAIPLKDPLQNSVLWNTGSCLRLLRLGRAICWGISGTFRSVPTPEISMLLCIWYPMSLIVAEHQLMAYMNVSVLLWRSQLLQNNSQNNLRYLETSILAGLERNPRPRSSRGKKIEYQSCCKFASTTTNCSSEGRSLSQLHKDFALAVRSRERLYRFWCALFKRLWIDKHCGEIVQNIDSTPREPINKFEHPLVDHS